MSRGGRGGRGGFGGGTYLRPSCCGDSIIIFFLGRGGGRGGAPRDAGPPDTVFGTHLFFLRRNNLTYFTFDLRHTEMGTFMHAVEDEMLCSSLMPDKVPYFNAPIYLQNKSVIGKVDEILGPINEVYFSVKMGEGMVASSFKKGDKVYIGGDKLLPIERFLPRPKVAGGACSVFSSSFVSLIYALNSSRRR